MMVKNIIKKLGIFCLLLLLTASAAEAHTVWIGGAVDSRGNVGQYTAIKFHNSTLQISYYNASSGDLKYAIAKNFCGIDPTCVWTWVSYTVDSVGNVGQYTSLALDSKSTPHVSYYNASSGDLKYAKRVGTGGNCGPIYNWNRSWRCEIVDSVGNVGQYTSIALDSKNTPHISYYNASSGDLKYAKKTTRCYIGSPCTSYWISETVESLGTVGLYTSIALDSNNIPHISYYNASSGDLKYAKRVGTGGNCGPIYNGNKSWRCEIVDSVGNVGQYTSIALDSNNTPHISYYNASSGDLKHAKKSCVLYICKWVNETVDSTGTVGLYTSIALDSYNTPHISYYNSGSGDLKYAERIGKAGNCGLGYSWECLTIDSEGNVGLYTSLALDSDNNPHISFYNASSGDLQHDNYVVFIH